MIKLSAYQTTTVLPNPELNDSENLTDDLNIKRSMQGNYYTYIKRKNQRRHLSFQIKLTRMKALELRAFIKCYFNSEIILIDHLNHCWKGKLTSNPFEYESLLADIQMITLEFEGVLCVP